MSFALKPTRMTVSDQRPSLSYRVGVSVRSRAERHWVELVLASDPSLFDPAQADRRTPESFVRFTRRFALPGGDAVIHVPPPALRALAGANRIYAGAALFTRAEGGQPAAVIRPDAKAVYVEASGFTGAGLHWRFGFSARPGLADAPDLARDLPVRWSGDRPTLGSAPVTPASRNDRPPAAAALPAEGPIPMQHHQGFMHKGGVAPQMPTPAAAPNGNGMAQGATAQPGGPRAAAPVDYDDGYGAPPPAILPQNGQHAGNGYGPAPTGNGHTAAPMPNGNGAPPQNGYGAQPAPHGNGAQMPPNGAGAHPQPNGNGAALHPNGNGAHAPQHAAQPMPVMPGGAQGQPMPVMPNGAQTGPQAAAQAYYARPFEYVLPDFDSYWPMDVIRTLGDAWDRYQSFSAGVSDTRQFPFSSIVCIRGLKRQRSDNALYVGTGTAFYIGPNLLLTNAHNFAGSSRFHPVHQATLFAGLNSQQGPGNQPVAGDAVSSETINPAAVTIHPLYSSSDRSVSKAHDLALVRVANAAPHGQFFRIANFSPAADTRIAVCGYGVGSHAQGDKDFDWQDMLPEALADYRQHMDADIIRELANGGEGIHYNLQTLAGNSGSPVFIAPEQISGEDPTALMQVIAVHSSGSSNTYNHGVLLTPDKRDWALSGGAAVAASHGYHGAPSADYAYRSRAHYSQPMVAPPTWAPIAASLVGTAATAGIAGLASSSGDLTWNLQKMDGWQAVGAHPSPTIPVDPATLRTRRGVEINSPVYQGTLQGNMYAHFMLDFKYDGTGVGGISIEPAPHDSHDNLTGGMRIDMAITPLAEAFPSQTQVGVHVACVEVKMMYTYEWTVEDNDQVTVIYRFYGDGTYDSRVRGGTAALDNTSTSYAPYRR